MARAADLDPNAFEIIYDRHGGQAFSLACRICGDRTLAEDVTQAAFLSVWRNAAGYDAARGGLRTWILGIVHNRAIDALRARSRHDSRRAGEEGLENLEEPRRTEAEVVQAEQASEIRQALQALPPAQRDVVELAYFAGLTHVEIAQLRRQPVGTVKGRLRLAHGKLRLALTAPAVSAAA